MKSTPSVNGHGEHAAGRTISLHHPIEIGDKTIASVTLRRPKGKDMILIGDHLPVLATLDREKPEEAMNAAVFKAMVSLAGVLGDIGEEAANELDFVDLISVALGAFSFVGEDAGRGAAPTTGA